MAVYTQHSVYLDLLNYLAPGCSYSNYIKSFLKDDCTFFKGFFPYDWMTATRKLNNVTVPLRSAFYSAITEKNISAVGYAHCKKVWEDQGMKTFRDYLLYTNHKDVEPFS